VKFVLVRVFKATHDFFVILSFSLGLDISRAMVSQRWSHCFPKNHPKYRLLNSTWQFERPIAILALTFSATVAFECLAGRDGGPTLRFGFSGTPSSACLRGRHSCGNLMITGISDAESGRRLRLVKPNHADVVKQMDSTP